MRQLPETIIGVIKQKLKFADDVYLCRPLSSDSYALQVRVGRGYGWCDVHPVGHFAIDRGAFFKALLFEAKHAERLALLGDRIWRRRCMPDVS